MRLLFLTPQLPYPPRQGTAIRNWGLIKSLAARHEIHLLTLAMPEEVVAGPLLEACKVVEVVPLGQPRSARQRLVGLATSPLPDLAHRLYTPVFQSRVERLLKENQFDALVVEGLELGRALTDIRVGVPTVYDAHNCESVLQQRAYETDLRRPTRWPAALYSAIQARRLARFEALVCRTATQVTCVSNEDAAALQQLTPGLRPTVAPNGIFVEEYAKVRAEVKPDTLVFTGKMDYRPNVDAVTWFANDILPLIQRERPQVEFVIVGQKPALAVQQLAGRRGVVVTGAVEDAKPTIAEAAVYVAPLRIGGGTRFKLLEAMALRRPIVSTTVGAEGFGVQTGKELLLADTPEAFAKAVLGLLNGTTKGQALAEAGYAFVQGYDWKTIAPKVEGVLGRP